MKNNQITDVDDEGPISKRSNNAVAGADGEVDDTEVKMNEYEHLPVLFDRWLQLKCILIFFIFVFWVTAIVVTYYLGDYAGTDADFDKGDLYTFVELTVPNAREFVMCWYLSIFIWGTLINEIRIFVIALLAPIRAQELFERAERIQNLRSNPDKERNWQKEWKDFHRKTMFSKASFKTCCLIPPESVEIALDCLYTIEIVKDGPYIFEGEGKTDNPAERYDAFDVNEKDHVIFSRLINNSAKSNSEKKGSTKGNDKSQDIELANRSNIGTKRSNAPLAETKFTATTDRNKGKTKEGKLTQGKKKAKKRG